MLDRILGARDTGEPNRPNPGFHVSQWQRAGREQTSALRSKHGWERVCIWGWHPANRLLFIFSPLPLRTQPPVSPHKWPEEVLNGFLSCWHLGHHLVYPVLVSRVLVSCCSGREGVLSLKEGSAVGHVLSQLSRWSDLLYDSWKAVFFTSAPSLSSFFNLFLAVLGLRCYLWRAVAVLAEVTSFSSRWLLLADHRPEGAQASVVKALRLVAPRRIETSPDQGSNLCPLHWHTGSYPLDYQGSPVSSLRQNHRLFKSCIEPCVEKKVPSQSSPWSSGWGLVRVPFIHHRSERRSLVWPRRCEGALWVAGFSPLRRFLLRSWTVARLGFPGTVLIVYLCSSGPQPWGHPGRWAGSVFTAFCGRAGGQHNTPERGLFLFSWAFSNHSASEIPLLRISQCFFSLATLSPSWRSFFSWPILWLRFCVNAIPLSPQWRRWTDGWSDVEDIRGAFGL